MIVQLLFSVEVNLIMGSDIRSRTAEATAMLRAQHYLHDSHPLILEDPFALHLLSPQVAELARAHGFQQPSNFRSAAVVLGRSRYAEDCFGLALDRGVQQFVLLGAGLDTFAQRRPDLMTRVHVYEIDKPATQEWKLEMLQSIGCEIAENLEFVPADLEQETVLQALGRSSFRRAEPAFFSWLGNTMYLTREAIFRTLESFVSELTVGSEVVFDYRVPIEFIDPVDADNVQASWKGTAEMGEPQYAWLNPLTLSDEVRAVGFEVVESLTPQQLGERYFSHRNDALQPMTHHHYIHLRTA